MSDQPPDGARFSDPALTWSALLGHWTDFARASVALPKDGEGGRWRSAVAPAIALQAVTLALRQAHALPGDERALAFDRSEVLIRRHAAELHALWRTEAMPPLLAELIGEAIEALRRAREAGLEWVVTGTPEGGVVEAPDPTEAVRALLTAGFRGELWLATPGTLLVPGDLGAYARVDAASGDIGAALGEAWLGLFGAQGEARRTPCRRQVYRQADPATGRLVRDLIAPTDATLPAGRPLLEPWIEGDALVGACDAARASAWAEAQRRALAAFEGEGRALPVEALDEAEGAAND